MEWETIAQPEPHDRTQRMKVPGGWLVCRINGIHLPHSMTSWFVQDRLHRWEPNKDEE